MGGRFAGEVSSIELSDGGLELVGVENDVRCDPAVGVDLRDAQQLGFECRGLLTAAEDDTDKGDAVAADRKDLCGRVCHPEVGDRPRLRQHRGPAAARTAESSTPVLEPDVVGEQRAELVPALVRSEEM